MLVTGTETVKELTWQGPASRGKKGKHKFTKENKLQVISQALSGLVAYIENANAEDLKNWGNGQRNELAHNGEFIDALFPETPEGKNRDGTGYGAKKMSVKAMRKDLADREVGPSKDLETGLQAVMTALEAKGVNIVAEKAAVLGQLNEVCA
jgi:hypothetical protein